VCGRGGRCSQKWRSCAWSSSCRGGGRRGCAGAATGEVLPGRRPERLEVTSSMEAPAPGRARAGAAADEVVHGMLLLESLIKIC
jgi:hypothetical protein